MTLAKLSIILLAGFASAQTVTVDVNAGKRISDPIPRTVFGTFLEPIGHSIYGGLWAELLTNPSFEEKLWSAEVIGRMIADEPGLKRASALGLPLPWEPLDVKQANRYEPRWGDAANSWRSLSILGLPDQPVGVRQKIFLPVHRTRQYRGSLYAKHLSGPERLKLSLRGRDNPTQILAQTEIAASSNEWRKLPFALELQANSLAPLTPVDFAIEVEGDERVLVDQASLVPSDAIDGLDPDEVRMARELKTPLLRFGGNFTSAYHWRDGVGDPDKRVSTLNISWQMPEYNTFGTDEFLRFCQLIGAEPQVALNLGSGTAAEAADWVRYVNERWGNHGGGLFWELGNELWGNWNLGYPTLNELPKRTEEFSRAIRAVDPKARLIATGQDPDHFETWNAAQLTTPSDTFQLLSTHFVVRTGEAVSKEPTEEGLAGASFALPVELGRRVDEIEKQIGGKRARVAFTEWLFHCCRAGQKRAPAFTNMGGAIIAGGFMNMLLTHSGTVPVSDMTGLMEFTGIWKKRERVYAAPSYYAFQLYSTADIDHLVDLDSDARMYTVHEGITRLPEIEHVPYLEVVAAVNKDSSVLTLFCVNRDLKRDFDTNINLKGFNGREARVKTLSAPDIYAENNEENPERVVPKDSMVSTTGSTLRFNFPHESVTRIEIRR